VQLHYRPGPLHELTWRKLPKIITRGLARMGIGCAWPARSIPLRWHRLLLLQHQTDGGAGQAIGNTGDVEKYSELAQTIKAKFAEKFIKPDGRIVDDKNQTGQTLYALAFGLGPGLQPAARASGAAICGGNQETELAPGHRLFRHPLCPVRPGKGGPDRFAYRLVLNQTYPSWLLQVKLGSTTMWERWDGWTPEKGISGSGMNSFNHYWLGCVGEWLSVP